YTWHTGIDDRAVWSRTTRSVQETETA
ncbi:hypothetical protein MGSAQ_002068, partial [marine sediment metagenome]